MNLNQVNQVSQVDPDWAWAPCEFQQWTRCDAAHLYRRAGFGASAEELDSAIRSHPTQVVQELVRHRSESVEYVQEIESLAQSILATADVKNLPAWWAYRLLTTPDQLREKATLFWHGHFATSGEKVTDAELMFRQNAILREFALGDFGKLLHEISRDPAMMIYLDSVSNRKAHPNENYAREIMELFCLGEGNYSERDIRELARCFTGWEVRRGKFRFNRYQHDTGEKMVLGQTGPMGGDEGVDVVLEQRSAAEFIVKKLIRFFLFDEPSPPQNLVDPLAREFRQNGLQVDPIVETMLASNLFFSEHVVGRKVRSPIEFSIGLLRTLEGTTDLFALTNGMSPLGQTLFFPPNVKGWDGGRTWINSSTMIARANFVQALLRRPETRFAHGTLSDFFDKHHLSESQEIVEWLEETSLAVSLTNEVRSELHRIIDHGPGDREQRLRDGLYLLCTLPEYQLG